MCKDLKANLDTLIIGIPKEKQKNILRKALRRRDIGIVKTFLDVCVNRPGCIDIEDFQSLIKYNPDIKLIKQ